MPDTDLLCQLKLHDGTRADVYQADKDCYEFLLTRLNSEKHNFFLRGARIEESYETRFDKLQEEAVELFRQWQQAVHKSGEERW